MIFVQAFVHVSYDFRAVLRAAFVILSCFIRVASVQVLGMFRERKTLTDHCTLQAAFSRTVMPSLRRRNRPPHASLSNRLGDLRPWRVRGRGGCNTRSRPPIRPAGPCDS